MRTTPTTRRHRLALAAAPTATALALVTACGSGQATTGGNASAPARQGGTLTMLSVGDSVGLDPFSASYGSAPSDSARMNALYDPLVYQDPATGAVQPDLAQSLTSTDQGATWTLRLRQGVNFSDGTPFDAAAVARTWTMHADPAVRSQHRAAAVGLRLDVLDPLTLRITPPDRNAAFDRTVATDLAYVEAPSALDRGPDSYRDHPVGAGPFTLHSWIRGSRQEFTRNPTYWQKDKGLPRLDQVTVQVVADINQQYSTLRSGGADLVISVDSASLQRAEKEMHSQTVHDNGGQAMQFNLTRPPFNDPRARRALALALNPADIPAALDNGYVPATGEFNPSSPFYDAQAQQPPQDRQQAQHLLDALAAEGHPVDFTYVVPNSPVAVKVAEFVQSRLSTFHNVHMAIQPLEIGTYTTRIGIQHDFQATLYADWELDPEPRMFNALYSTSPQNLSGWKNADADRALLAGRSSTDPTARATAYAALQRALAADLPMFVYARSDQGPIYTDRVAGVQVVNTGTVLMDRIGLRG